MPEQSNKDLYYVKQAVGDSYLDDPFEFMFDSVGVMIVNDSGQDLFFSVDGANDYGQISPSDKTIVFDNFSVRKLWIRGTAGQTVDIRAWAWPRT